MDSLAAPNHEAKARARRPDARPRGRASSKRSRGRARARSPTSCGRPGSPGRRRTGSRSRSRSTRSWCGIAPVASGSGGRLVGWGAAAGAGLALVEPARAVLERLSAETGESAQLYVREGDQRVCVATHERPTGLRDTVALGAMMPLTKGSGGRVSAGLGRRSRSLRRRRRRALGGARRGMGRERGGARARGRQRERTRASGRGGRGRNRGERAGGAVRARSGITLRRSGRGGGRRPFPRSRRTRHHAVIPA